MNPETSTLLEDLLRSELTVPPSGTEIVLVVIAVFLFALILLPFFSYLTWARQRREYQSRPDLGSTLAKIQQGLDEIDLPLAVRPSPYDEIDKKANTVREHIRSNLDKARKRIEELDSLTDKLHFPRDDSVEYLQLSHLWADIRCYHRMNQQAEDAQHFLNEASHRLKPLIALKQEENEVPTRLHNHIRNLWSVYKEILALLKHENEQKTRGLQQPVIQLKDAHKSLQEASHLLSEDSPPWEKVVEANALYVQSRQSVESVKAKIRVLKQVRDQVHECSAYHENLSAHANELTTKKLELIETVESLTNVAETLRTVNRALVPDFRRLSEVQRIVNQSGETLGAIEKKLNSLESHLFVLSGTAPLIAEIEHRANKLEKRLQAYRSEAETLRRIAPIRNHLQDARYEYSDLVNSVSDAKRHGQLTEDQLEQRWKDYVQRVLPCTNKAEALIKDAEQELEGLIGLSDQCEELLEALFSEYSDNLQGIQSSGLSEFQDEAKKTLDQIQQKRELLKRASELSESELQGLKRGIEDLTTLSSDFIQRHEDKVKKYRQKVKKVLISLKQDVQRWNLVADSVPDSVRKVFVQAIQKFRSQSSQTMTGNELEQFWQDAEKLHDHAQVILFNREIVGNLKLEIIQRLKELQDMGLWSLGFEREKGLANEKYEDFHKQWEFMSHSITIEDLNERLQRSLELAEVVLKTIAEQRQSVEDQIEEIVDTHKAINGYCEVFEKRLSSEQLTLEGNDIQQAQELLAEHIRIAQKTANYNKARRWLKEACEFARRLASSSPTNINQLIQKQIEQRLEIRHSEIGDVYQIGEMDGDITWMDDDTDIRD